MMDVSLDLMSFVETNILPKYTAFGHSHGLGHVQRVIANSLVLARKLGADVNMVYAIAQVVFTDANQYYERGGGGSSGFGLA